jgi:hypothetical protein
MRRLVVSLLVLAACAKTENTPTDTTTAMAAPPPAAPVAVTPADWAGDWSGTAMPMNKDTVITTMEITATGTKDGWVLRLPNGASPKLTVVELSGDSVVTDAGPFKSATRKGQTVTIHSIYHLTAGKVTGLTHAKFSAGDTSTIRVSMTKKAAP